MARIPLVFRSLAVRIAHPFMRLGLRLGESVARLGERIVRSVAGTEARIVREVIEEEAELQAEERQVLGLPMNERIPEGSIPEALTKMRRQFSWQVRFGFIDPLTAQRAERYLNVSTDRHLTAMEALDEARNMLEEDYKIDASFIVEEKVIGVKRAGSAGRL